VIVQEPAPVRCTSPPLTIVHWSLAEYEMSRPDEEDAPGAKFGSLKVLSLIAGNAIDWVVLAMLKLCGTSVAAL